MGEVGTGLRESARIRAGRREDAAPLYALLASVLTEFGLSPEPDGLDSDLADVETAYAARGGMFLVAVDASDRVVGSVAMLPCAEGVCELRKLYLLRTWRGRGLGRTLLQSALEWAREQGYIAVELETAANMHQAIHLYERAGFRLLDESTHAARCARRFRLDLK